MNANVTISRESKLQMERLLAGSEKLYNRSVYRSLQTAVKGTKTDKTAAVLKHYNLKKSAVTKRIKAQGPRSYRRLTAYTIAASKPISLISFKGTRQVNAGVRVRVKSGGGLETIPRAFVQTAKTAKQVFWRVRKDMPDKDIWPSKKRLKRNWSSMPGIQYPQGRGGGENLRALKGPRITDILSDPFVMQDVEKLAGERLLKELKRQIELSLKEL